jgi:hypothetical protein
MMDHQLSTMASHLGLGDRDFSAGNCEANRIRGPQVIPRSAMSPVTRTTMQISTRINKNGADIVNWLVSGTREAAKATIG